ncbi:MAG TPA: methyltransferase domain-containing protein, partial [Streptosporangiaceae bacterium]
MDATGDQARIAEQMARQASSFGTQAAAYAEHRPDYAEAAVRWAMEPVRGRAPVRVLDIGAGTGKLTGVIARLALAGPPAISLVTVEPDPAMLAELRRLLPELTGSPPAPHPGSPAPGNSPSALAGGPPAPGNSPSALAGGAPVPANSPPVPGSGSSEPDREPFVITTMAGDAEHIPLPDGSVDVVLAGQAAHWFNMEL